MALAAILSCAASGASAAESNDDVTARSWIVWNANKYFGPCREDCGIAIYGGRELRSSVTRVFGIHSPWIPPSEWQMGRAYILAVSLSRRLATVWDVLEVEPEIGTGKRFGNQGAIELWGALSFRWTRFPWNDYLVTTLGFPAGISYVTRQDQAESDLNSTDGVPSTEGLAWHFFFAPELTFALPRNQKVALILRMHHRSSGVIKLSRERRGASFATFGIRVRL